MLRFALTVPKGTIGHLQILVLIILLGSFVVPGQGKAQSLTSPGNITIEEGGRIWIEGTAGPVDFSCRAEQLSGSGKIKNVQNPEATVTDDGQINIAVSLPVKSLNCGKRAMNRDMYGALRAENNPVINYRVLEASLRDQPADTAQDQWMNIQTQGIMEIAGVQDTTTVFVQGKILDNRFRVRGSKEIHMDTYDIEPPSKMMGLIRASKNLTVHFDVTVVLSDTAS